MKHYKHPTTGELYAYEEDGSQDAIIPAELAPVTQAQADAILAAMIPPPTPEEIDALRRAAYQAEADPLFFKYQRGEATREEWLAKVDEIRARYP